MEGRVVGGAVTESEKEGMGPAFSQGRGSWVVIGFRFRIGAFLLSLYLKQKFSLICSSLGVSGVKSQLLIGYGWSIKMGLVRD